MKHDLKNIPERFHVLFTDTTWNKGDESKLTSLQRADMNQLYLEYNSWSIQESLKKTIQEAAPIGFIRD